MNIIQLRRSRLLRLLTVLLLVACVLFFANRNPVANAENSQNDHLKVSYDRIKSKIQTFLLSHPLCDKGTIPSGEEAICLHT